MSVREYVEKRIGQHLGIVRAGFPKEVSHRGKLLRVESEMAVLEDDDGKEWAVPLDKVLVITPPDAGEDERAAGFRGDK